MPHGVVARSACCLCTFYQPCLPKTCSFYVGTKVRRLSFLLFFPCLTFSYTCCPSSHHLGCPPYFLLSLSACLSCFPFIYQLSVSFQPRSREFATPLDLCNTPSSFYTSEEFALHLKAAHRYIGQTNLCCSQAIFTYQKGLHFILKLLTGTLLKQTEIECEN